MGQTTNWACQFSPAQAPQRVPLKLADGYETVVYVHHPPAGVASKLPVMQIHGIQSHPGWFGGSAAALAAEGHTVFQVTRRGSGENTVARGHAASAEQLLDDVRVACDFVLSQTGRERLHLVGISWGGKLLACYCTDPTRAARVASLTLIAPGIAPRVDVSPLKKLAIGLSLLICPRRPFDIPLNEVELFTDNPAMREYLRSDALRLRQATAKFLYVSRVLDVQLRRATGKRGHSSLREESPLFPVTLLLAKRDRIIDNARTRSIMEKLVGRSLRVVELDAAHTMEFEENQAEFHHALTAATED